MVKFQRRLPCRWPEPLYSANGPFCTESLPYPIPTANVGDLRGVWELMQETHAKFLGNREPEVGGQQPTIGIDISLLARVCRPEADVLAVWARSALLGIFVQQGLLTSWQRGTQLDDAVLDVAAIFPIPGFDRFDPNAFLQQLSSRGR